MSQGGKKEKPVLAKQKIVLANREIKTQLSLHANSIINVKEASALSRGHLLLDIMFIDLSCFTTKANGFMLDYLLLSLRYVNFLPHKTCFVSRDYTLSCFRNAGT